MRPYDLTTEIPVETQSWAEQYRIAAKKWVDAESAAELMKELKDVSLEALKCQIIAEHEGDMADNAATRLAKTKDDWRDYVTKMSGHRSEARRLKVQMEYIRMKHMEQQSMEATARAERKL